MSEVIKVQDHINGFREALTGAMNSIVTAGQHYVAAIDQDASCREFFHQKLSDIVPHSAWAGFEAVGRKQMHEKCLFGGGINGPFIKRLPYSDQERIFNGEKVELLVSGGDTLMVDPMAINKAQADQIFNGCMIRTPAEQRAYLESKKEVAAPVILSKPYTIKKGLVIINGVEFTKRDLLGMLEDM